MSILTRRRRQRWLIDTREENLDSPAFAHAYLLARYIGGISAIIGLLVIATSLLDLPFISASMETWSEVSVLEGLSFVLLGTAMVLRSYYIREVRARGAIWNHEAADVLACMTLAISVFALLINYYEDTAIDTLGSDPLRTSMTTATAGSLLLLAIGVLIIFRVRSRLAFTGLTCAALLLGWIGFSGHMYAVEIPCKMAIHASILVMANAAGLLALRPDLVTEVLIACKDAAGTHFRRLVPASIVLPLVAGALAVGVSDQSVGIELTISTLALFIAVSFGAMAWIYAAYVNRTRIEHELAQQSLLVSQKYTRLIIENALDAVITIDTVGLVTEWNSQAERTFGWRRDEVIGKMLAELIIPPELREAHTRGIERYLKTGEQQVLNRRIEITARRRDQQEFPVELSITPISTENGIAFSAFLRNITERRAVIDAMRHSEERLRMLAESLPNLVWTCQPSGECDYLSRQWVDYTGRPESEQLDYGWVLAIHADDRKRAQLDWHRAITLGQTYDTEFRLRRHDGRYRWFKSRGIPLRNAEGQVIRWFGSSTDVEDYKGSEARLKVQLQHLKLLDRATRAIAQRHDLASIFGAVLRSLEDDFSIVFGAVVFVEPSGKEVRLGSMGKRSRNLAKSIPLMEGQQIPNDGELLKRALGGEFAWTSETVSDDGTLTKLLQGLNLISIVYAPLRVDDLTWGVMILARYGAQVFESEDREFLRQLCEHVALAAHQAKLHTELEAAYKDLTATQEALVQQERLRALGQIAGGVAHDINNALSPALLYAQSIQESDETLSPEAHKALRVIQRALEDIANTVTRMREFYRPQQSAQQAIVNLNELISHVLELTRARWDDMAQEHGTVIDIVTDLAPVVPAISGAENEIRDALANLVFNAVDAMPNGGKLTLRTRVEEDTVVVEVSDTGIGMDENARRRCLEPFYTTKGDRGSGLGLAMVYGMAQRHDAHIGIESDIGKGTTMSISFPKRVRTESAPLPEADALPQRSLRLLAIDDDPLVLESLQMILLREGHDVTVAEGGPSGVQEFAAALGRGSPYELVMTDLGMPEMDGREVAATIKKASPATPVVLLTGWGYRFESDRAQIPDVDHILGKPPKRPDLRRVLARAANTKVH